MKKFKEYFKIYESEETKEVFEQNEFAANRLSLWVIFSCTIILVIAWILNTVGIFSVAKTRMTVLAIVGLVEFSVPIVLYFIYNGKKRWLKYVMVIALLFVCTNLFCILNHNVILIMILPVLLSSRYFSKGFTVMISILAVVFQAAASVVTVMFGIVDLNFFPKLADGTVITVQDGLRTSVMGLGLETSRLAVSMLVNGFLPRLLVLTIIIFISML